MKDALLILFRHTFAAIAAMLVHHGIHADAGSSVSMLAGVLVFGFVTLLSAVLKMDLDDDKKAALQKLAAALASQFVAALAGWLQADAATAADPAALSLFLGNMTLSKLRGHVPPARVLGLLALCSLPFALSSCSSFTKADAKAAGEQIGLAAADTAILIARMQLAQANADLEAAKHEPGANANAILAKQLGVIAAQQALNAAERAMAKERARLDAKQPRNVQPASTAGMQSRPPSLPVSSSPRLQVPVYAPRVVAMLKAR